MIFDDDNVWLGGEEGDECMMFVEIFLLEGLVCEVRFVGFFDFD